MRNVERVSEPNSLRENFEKWTNDLLTAIAYYRENGVKIRRTLKNRYNKKDILDALKQMYDDGNGIPCCCYCESPIEPVGFPHIEHRKPKDINLYPEESFNWTNLHLACETCNKKKGTKWNGEHEILDAVIDLIEDHLSYAVEPEGVFREKLSMRGITTIDHTDLNRKPLTKTRLNIYILMLQKIQEIKLSKDEPTINSVKSRLMAKCTGQHGSLIKWMLQDWKII